MKNNHIVILLTACVQPNGMSFTKLQDSSIRKEQYIKSIIYYLENTKFNIVCVENTGFNFSSCLCHHKNSKRLECLTFYGNNYPKELGKGYGEAQIIKYAIDNSKHINKGTYIIKITGRLIIKNINSIINPLLLRISKNIIQIDFYSKSFVNSTCFICPSTWISKTIQLYENHLNDTAGYYFEHMLYNSIIKSSNILLYPIIPPFIIGISGTQNKPYINGPSIKYRKMNNLSFISNIYRIKGNNIMNYWYKCLLYKSIILDKLHKLTK